MLASRGEIVDSRGGMNGARKTAEVKNGMAACGAMLWGMVWLSGFAGLVYQILWMRQLGLLLGNTSHAAALTLAVFFSGLAIGSWFWGGKCQGLTRPLRTYRWLECGIALGGLWVMAAPALFMTWYPLMLQRHGEGAVLWCFKLLLIWLMVFPPSMLMGGTLPVMSQWMVVQRDRFGTVAARLYAINTLGAACGAFATAFVLIAALGMRMTCGVAVGASMLAAMMAFFLAGKVASKAAAESSIKPPRAPVVEAGLSRRVIRGLAFFSGFQLLALEVIWTRMLAQVHENSVYSFSAVLIVVLLCLAWGSALASRLARSGANASRCLVFLFAAGATLLMVMPFVFTRMTHSGAMLPMDRNFAAYVGQLFFTTLVTIGPGCVLLGTVFPLLMKCEESHAGSAGRSLGELAAVNTLGAILGSLMAGFVLLEWWGVWRSVQVLVVLGLLVAVCLPAGKASVMRAAKYAAAGMALLALTVLTPARLPQMISRDSWGKPEVLLQKWESSDGTVAVVRDSEQHVAIKINAHYSLGSTYAYESQVQQARMPLLAFPQCDSVFFLGMGTGITAGEALDRKVYPAVQRVVTCELSAAVVAASRKYFAGGMGDPDITNGLYTDPRSQVVIADGRHHLMAYRERYAMINADLFLPYRRGTGNLYSREHFQQVKARLKGGGVFVQWLPLYQISENEFGIIARTMLSVFPQVSLWRGNFQPGAEMAALVGHGDDSPVPACDMDVTDAKRKAVDGATHRDMRQLMLPINEQTVMMFYAGNVSRAADLFQGYAMNTDDRPVIEFGTPRSLHRAAGEGKPQFVQERFAGLVDRLFARTPPLTDPLLARRDPASRQLALAGHAFHRAGIAAISQNDEQWQQEWQVFLRHWLGDE